MTTGEIMTLLSARGFRFTHSLGQNFLVDDRALETIVRGADVENKNVLEIGAGAGCLTSVLCQYAKRVLTVEIDEKLIPVLETVLAPYKNVKLVEGDALQLDLKALTEEYFEGEPFCVVANLPYYITTPILETLLGSRLPLLSMTVMLQKEAAQRVQAQPGNKEYSPLAVHLRYRCKAEKLLVATPDCFSPQPHVESVVLKFTMREDVPPVPEEGFVKLVKSCFLMRRKTLLNNLLGYGLNRETAGKVIADCGFPPSVRAEALSLEDFIHLYQSIH